MNSKDMNHDDNALHEIDPVADARVTDALNGLGTVEPPPELFGQVMWRTKHQSVRNSSRRRMAGRKEEGLDMAKKVLIGLVGIAAAGLLAAYISGFPATTGTEGTIGAAQRYNAEQIKKSDVTVENPALAAFLQSDVFEKLSRDKMAVAALTSPEVQQALADADISAALADSTLVQVLADPNVQAALTNPALAQALASPELQQALIDAEAADTGLSAAGLNKLGLDSQLASALANPALVEALANPTLAQAMLNPNFAAALASPGLQGALASPALSSLLADSTAAQLLGAQLQSAQLAATTGANALGANGAFIK